MHLHVYVVVHFHPICCYLLYIAVVSLKHDTTIKLLISKNDIHVNHIYTSKYEQFVLSHPQHSALAPRYFVHYFEIIIIDSLVHFLLVIYRNLCTMWNKKSRKNTCVCVKLWINVPKPTFHIHFNVKKWEN